MNVDSAKSQLAHAQDHIEDVLFVINIEKPLKPKDEELRATLVSVFEFAGPDPDTGWTLFQEAVRFFLAVPS